MINKFKLIVVLLFLGCFFAQSSLQGIPVSTDKGYAKEEDTVKGVWVATVFSLDFPKNPTTNSSSLKKELDSIVKDAKDMGFNTIFFQVRPSSDAFYKSEIFPWSKYLTGKMGLAPENNFDPLKYMVDICHKNNIKIHAWINPYRVAPGVQESENQPENSISTMHPDWIINYNGKLYLNPGIPEVNDFIAEGAMEIVKNYNVDGIQIDDYFYPGEDFPDDWSFSEYGKNYENIADWRRHNIDDLIIKMNKKIKEANPFTKFGVSPQGIWANKENHTDGSDTNGREAYFSSYADTRKWTRENMIDYIIPQIYWNIGYAGADYKILTDWWADVCKDTNVELYIGQAAYKANETTDTESIWFGESGIGEIEKQINIAKYNDNISGYCLYRLSSISSPEFKKAVTDANNKEKDIFSDLDDAQWAKEDIKALHKKGIISGMGDGSFGVSNKLTRGQFAVMISRLLGKKADFKDNFSDVPSDKYYYNDIGILKELNLIQGVSETEFAPESLITRQDMSVLVYRILIKEKIIEDKIKGTLDFEDSSEIRDYAKDAVSALHSKKIINGYEDNTFKPYGNATRAEAAVILNRILGLINQ